MPNPDREVKTVDTGGRVGWVVAGIIVCLLLVGGYVFRDALFGAPSEDINIDTELPVD